MTRTRAEVRRDNRNAATIAMLAVGLLLAAFLLSPGITLIAFAVRPFALGMDRVQLWGFSVVACALVYVGLRLAAGDKRRANLCYLGLCALSFGAFAMAKFGLQAHWPDLVVAAFVRGGS